MCKYIGYQGELDAGIIAGVFQFWEIDYLTKGLGTKKCKSACYKMGMIEIYPLGCLIPTGCMPVHPTNVITFLKSIAAR
jgi:hypothetical protein